MQNSILIQQKHDRIRLRKSKRDINSPEQKDLNLKKYLSFVYRISKFLQGEFMKKFLFALIAIFVLAGCGSDPKGVAEDFIRALYEGDSKTLVDAIDIPDKDRSDDGSMQMINGKLMQMAGAGKEEASKRDGLKGVSGELQNSDEKSALVKVTVSFKNGTNRTESVKLVKKDGKWKVSL